LSDTDEERQLRIDQMTVNIDKMRADMAAQQTLLAWETRKFVIQALTAAAGLLAAGGIIGGVMVNYINAHQPPAPPITQYVLPPGTVVQVPK
jgi:hypothetical protein